MVSALLDSSVLIDLLRGYRPAIDWLNTQEQLGVTQIVWLELLDGAKNKTEQRQATELLRRFALVTLNTQDIT